MSGLPDGTIVASAFGGIAPASDGYYEVFRFIVDNGKAHLVALPPDQVSAVVSSACLSPQRTTQPEDGKVIAFTFPSRDVSICPAVAPDEFVLRVGFLEESNIQFLLSREAVIRLADMLRKAAS